MSNTESICCPVGYEINTDQLNGQNRCHLHAAERKKMDTAGCKCRYHQHLHVHFQEAHSSESEEKDEEEEKELNTTDSDDSYSIDLPRHQPHYGIPENEIATNLNKLMTVVKILQDKVDELTEM